jgi:hypothetical protein
MGNNFFGGGIGGTVTPRRRGGAIRWHGGLGAEHNAATSVDASSLITGIGVGWVSVYAVTRLFPKAKRRFDSYMNKGKPVTAAVEGALAVVEEVLP